MKSKILQRNAQYDRQVAALLDEIALHDPIRFNTPSADGGWSAIQTLHHLLLAEELTLGYIRRKSAQLADAPRLTAGVHFRALLLRLSLASPIKFKAPAGVSTDQLPLYASLADTRQRWQNIRADWTQYLVEMPDDLIDKAVYKHPRAGRIGWLQTLGFFQWHLARHAKQVRRALR